MISDGTIFIDHKNDLFVGFHQGDFRAHFFLTHNNQICHIGDISDSNEKLSCSGYINNNCVLKAAIEKKNASITITIAGEGKIGIMYPLSSTNIYFGDEIYSEETRFNHKRAFKTEEDDLYIPCVTDVVNNTSIFCENSCTIFTLPYDYRAYCHFTTSVSPTNICIKTGSRRNNLEWWNKQHNKNDKKILVADDITITQMQDILLNLRPIQKPRTARLSLIYGVQNIQNLLQEHGITSYVIGSLAIYLHGISTHVQDADMLIPEDQFGSAVEVLSKTYNTEHSTEPKWKNCSLKILLDKDTVDISFNSKRHNTTKIRGMWVITLKDLLVMKLLGEHERQVMMPANKHIKVKNHTNILSLLRKSPPPIYPFWHDSIFRRQEERFWRLYELMQGSVWKDIEISVNYPMVANTFVLDNKVIIPIINTGTSQPGQIRIVCFRNEATWLPLEKDKEILCVISDRQWIHARTIRIPIVEDLGLLILS